MLFASYAESVTMLVRGKTLAASMSQYLIDQLATKANVTIETEVEVVAVEGTDRLEAIEVVAGPTRRRERREAMRCSCSSARTRRRRGCRRTSFATSGATSARGAT